MINAWQKLLECLNCEAKFLQFQVSALYYHKGGRVVLMNSCNSTKRGWP
jgi:hypothetical protein